jgi:hypothetical protein
MVSAMKAEEMTQLQTIVKTLADPKGNWQFGWEVLCKMANMDPEKYRAHFEAHPIEPRARRSRTSHVPPEFVD